MFALGDQLDAMTIYQLLETLLDKLDNVRSIVRAFPEAKQTLVIAINRLAELASEGFAITKVPRRAPMPVAQISNAINDAPATQRRINDHPLAPTSSMI